MIRFFFQKCFCKEQGVKNVGMKKIAFKIDMNKYKIMID